ncbi:S8 family serine peptidase [Kocuria sp. NPDC057446]|uniref:S8 family peptidase n=1 Tax=Kocuria sp. NPDC057446 TaxID=3346137 RepID=UPI0036ADBD71
MERTYYQRGERKTLEEIEDVVPVKLSGGDARALSDPGLDAADLGLPEDTYDAFRQASWVFVSPDAERAQGADGRTSAGPPQDAGKLVRRQGGQFGIVTHRLVVQLQEDIEEAEAEQVLSELALDLVSRLRFAPNLFEVDATTYPDALEASVALHEDPRVKIAEPSFQEHIPGRAAPMDPRYGEQWQWKNTGQTGGTSGADVSAEIAWDRTRGAGVRVAVIDNGFLVDHEDLQGAVSETSGFFIDADPGPRVRPQFVQGTAGMPTGDHGTFCAGMVGARQGNDLGGSGAAPECELMLLACLPDAIGDQVTLARAVAYAADPSFEVDGAGPGSGADILVCSLGPNGADWELATALDLALSFAPEQARDGAGMAVFWAASNGRNVDVLKDEVVSHPDVIAVVRSTHDDLEHDAARGSEVELIAPGVNVLSTDGHGGYHPSTGTSFAAPCAAGCAALALSANLDLTREQLRTIMRESADKIGGVQYDADGHNDDYGYGRVNAAAAVQAAEQLLSSPVRRAS